MMETLQDIFSHSAYFGLMLSIISYALGAAINRKFKRGVFNPLLIAIIVVIATLLVFRVNFASYNQGGKYLTYLLTPATVCLAIPLYQQLELLQKNHRAVLLGIAAGVFSSLASILVLSVLYQLSHLQYITLLPKSITNAFGIGVAQELGGVTPITVAVIFFTGVFGNIIAKKVCRLFKISEPIAVGLAIGTSSHVMGTVKALEIGEVEGAMSTLAIVVAGLMTVGVVPFFARLY